MKREWVAIFGSICNAKRMRKLPDNTCRLLYVLLSTQCDSHGRVEDDPDSIWAECWATFGPACSQDETVRALTALEEVGLIERHEAGGVRWIQVPDWEEKAGRVGEKNKRGKSDFPDPTPDSLATKSRLTRESVEDKSPTEREREREESRERAEGEGERAGARDPTPEVEVLTWSGVFSEFPALDQPECHAAYRSLVAMRKRKRFGEWEPETLRKHLRLFAPLGPHALVAALGESDRNEYRGLFPPKANGRVPPKDSMRAHFAAERASADAPPPREVEHENVR